MIRNILVPLDSQAELESVIRHACEIAHLTGAEVVGKVLIDSPDFHPGEESPLHASAVKLAGEQDREGRREVAHAIQEELSRFRRICDEEGVTHGEAFLQGLPLPLLAEQSMFYDLVVHGFHGLVGGDEGSQARSLTGLLDESVTPFLIVPASYRPLEEVVICYDGSLAATRSLQGCVSLLRGESHRVTVLCSDRDAKRSRYLLNRAERYLHLHDCGEVRKLATETPIREAIRSEVSTQPDLIVLGVHSRRRLRDFLVGSLVRDLLLREDTALFLGP